MHYQEKGLECKSDVYTKPWATETQGFAIHNYSIKNSTEHVSFSSKIFHRQTCSSMTLLSPSQVTFWT